MGMFCTIFFRSSSDGHKKFTSECQPYRPVLRMDLIAASSAASRWSYGGLWIWTCSLTCCWSCFLSTLDSSSCFLADWSSSNVFYFSSGSFFFPTYASIRCFSAWVSSFFLSASASASSLFLLAVSASSFFLSASASASSLFLLAVSASSFFLSASA